MLNGRVGNKILFFKTAYNRKQVTFYSDEYVGNFIQNKASWINKHARVYKYTWKITSIKILFNTFQIFTTQKYQKKKKNQWDEYGGKFSIYFM